MALNDSLAEDSTMLYLEEIVLQLLISSASYRSEWLIFFLNGSQQPCERLSIFPPWITSAVLTDEGLSKQIATTVQMAAFVFKWIS